MPPRYKVRAPLGLGYQGGTGIIPPEQKVHVTHGKVSGRWKLSNGKAPGTTWDQKLFLTMFHDAF